MHAPFGRTLQTKPFSIVQNENYNWLFEWIVICGNLIGKFFFSSNHGSFDLLPRGIYKKAENETMDASKVLNYRSMKPSIILFYFFFCQRNHAHLNWLLAATRSHEWQWKWMAELEKKNRNEMSTECYIQSDLFSFHPKREREENVQWRCFTKQHRMQFCFIFSL